jgi:DNA-binding CsgD family transcriptional regulator/PAS domain-containing protein
MEAMRVDGLPARVITPRVGAPRERLSGAAIVAAARGPAFSTDEDGRIRAWNDRAHDLLGYPARQAQGHRLGSLLAPADIHGNPLTWPAIPFAELAAAGEPLRPFEITLRAADGTRVPVTASVVVFFDGPSEAEELVYLLLPRYRRRRADEIIERLLARPGSHLQARATDPSATPAPPLTPRRAEVLRLLACGASTHTIAAELGVSVHTVRSHVQGLLHALGVRTRAQAVSRAYNLRYL